MKQYAYFNELPANTIFSLNGNQYRKRSTRTAKVTWPIEYNSNWFYFADKTLVEVGLHSRLEKEYFKVA